MAHQVEHHMKNLLFCIQLSDKSRAILEYRNLPNRVLDLYHTEVPSQHRGKGIAETLVRGAFRYCLDNNYKVQSSCSYVQKFGRELATEEEKKIILQEMIRH